MSIQWIEHRGKRILRSDHSGLKSDALIESEKQALAMMRDESGKVLVLNIYSGAFGDLEYMQKIKELGNEIEERTERNAIIGVRGVQLILLQAYNRVTGVSENQRLFDTEEEALVWLVS